MDGKTYEFADGRKLVLSRGTKVRVDGPKGRLGRVVDPVAVQRVGLEVDVEVGGQVDRVDVARLTLAS